MDDASHEMRMPLTSLTTSIEVGDHGPRIDEADRHGGRVWARSGPDSGAWVGFDLPAGT